MQDAYFFGYGSLVNRATHEYPQARPATVRGWRRVWTHTKLRKLAYLSVRPAPGAALDGLVARVPAADRAALDARERAYLRHTVTDHDTDLEGLHLYAVAPEHADAPDARHPILLSYIDVVVQGYLREFGPDGARRFFDSTEGWDTAILNDRAEPIYPRAQAIHAHEREFVDAQLKRLAVEPYQGV